MSMHCNEDLDMWEEFGLFFILEDDILFDCVTPIPRSRVLYKLHWVFIIMCGMVIQLECLDVTP